MQVSGKAAQQRFWWRGASGAPAGPGVLGVHRPVRTVFEADEAVARHEAAGAGAGTERRHGRRMVLAAGVAGALIFAVNTGFGRTARFADPLPRQIDRALATSGFMISEVILAGHKFTSDSEIYGALALEREGSILTYDVAAARHRVEALPWVLKADIKRVLPDGLSVSIEERRAAAVFEQGDKARLVDRSGRILANLSGTGRLSLLRISGDGAPEAVGALMAAIEPHADIAGRLVLAQRVGGRRWTLDLSDGVRVLLPAERDGEALLRLSRLQQSSRLLDQGGQTIDLRSDDMIVVSGMARTTAAEPASGRPPL